MFKECGLIEKYGSGISRIKKFCLEYNIIEPKFKELQKGFQVTLYKQVIDKKKDVGVNEIYDFIMEHQPIKTTSIAKSFTTVTKRTIERWIKQLKNEGKIEFIGVAKTGGYFVKDS